MAKYMLDLQLINICFIEYPPSLLAASALCLSRQLFHESDTPWPSTLSGYTRYTERDLMEAMQKTAKTLQEAPNSFFQVLCENSCYFFCQGEYDFTSICLFVCKIAQIVKKHLSVKCCGGDPDLYVDDVIPWVLDVMGVSYLGLPLLRPCMAALE